MKKKKSERKKPTISKMDKKLWKEFSRYIRTRDCLHSTGTKEVGSGTTGVACEKLNRKFIGIELDENYYNIACERIKKETQQLILILT